MVVRSVQDTHNGPLDLRVVHWTSGWSTWDLPLDSHGSPVDCKPKPTGNNFTSNKTRKVGSGDWNRVGVDEDHFRWNWTLNSEQASCHRASHNMPVGGGGGFRWGRHVPASDNPFNLIRNSGAHFQIKLHLHLQEKVEVGAVSDLVSILNNLVTLPTCDNN